VPAGLFSVCRSLGNGFFRRTMDSHGVQTLRVGEVDCATLCDEYFSIVRQSFSIHNDFLDGIFDFGNLGAGGGKGGDLMSRTECGKFFVKQLNTGDAKTLLDSKFLQAYVDLVSTKTSLLCKVVCVFTHPTLGRFLCMANCLPTHVRSWSGLYDLKGSADDKVMVEDGEVVEEIHKRCWKYVMHGSQIQAHCFISQLVTVCPYIVQYTSNTRPTQDANHFSCNNRSVSWMVCEASGCGKGIPASRTRYLSGKKRAYNLPVYLTKTQRVEVMTAMTRDCAFFEEFNLMDYSMIVGVHRPAPGEANAELQKSQNGLHGTAYASQHGGDTTIVYFGIIDFLQSWTGGKKCAHFVKLACAPPPISTVSPRKYAKQFCEFFNWKLRGVAHALPPHYADLNPQGQVQGVHVGKVLQEVTQLRAAVTKMDLKLTEAERRVRELETEKHETDFHDAR